jgi:hypothetical protein
MALLDATEAELDRLGALESVEGQLALKLAALIDEPRAGMATAGDSREFRMVMAQVRSTATPKEASPIDELIARRAARESAAKAV